VTDLPVDGRRRVVIEGVTPEIDAGRFQVKRVMGDMMVVEVDAFADGHDVLDTVLLHRSVHSDTWSETRMRPLPNDRWRGAFPLEQPGAYEYTCESWVDPFLTWRAFLKKRIAAGQDLGVELEIGAAIVESTAARASRDDATQLREWAAALAGNGEVQARTDVALDDALMHVMRRHADRRFATRYERTLRVHVDRERARFSTWYEFFPRSSAPLADAGRHGTFADCVARLDDIAAMGFDVVYLPPIHPIGRSFRKGPNNTLTPAPDDPGSPWAIGASEGGHDAIHPQLGTFDDFEQLIARAAERGMEIALDLAFQATPDHPWVRDHPEWFRHRPDGTIQYAENPPKKYQDIYPLDFESKDWRGLWEELERVIEFWVGHGVRIFRVDNPHTKAFAFWEWVIARVQGRHPDTIFLAEAFTRPKVMYRLAKLGFTQSYTYFAWRNTKEELTEYFTELTQNDVREYFRANLWPNTPDILTEYLQFGDRPAFAARYILAATLGASLGIYGPAYELGENAPREPGSEEYLNSEKYEIRSWPLDAPDSLRALITRVNGIRRRNPALQTDWGLLFHDCDNPSIICYSKVSDDGSNVMLMVVNLDVRHRQAGWLRLDLEALGVPTGAPFQVHDELGGGSYLWNGPANYVELDPHGLPAHVFRLRQKVRSEQDFDYYL
jgi:starch synthase (maltosyl-transferring)